MAKNNGLYRRSQSQLPRVPMAPRVPRGRKGKNPKGGPPHGVGSTIHFEPGQHLEGCGVKRPKRALARTHIVELEGDRRTARDGQGAQNAQAARKPRAARSARVPRSARGGGTDREVGLTYLAVLVLAVWCYVRILSGHHPQGIKVTAVLLVPVFLWAGSTIRGSLGRWGRAARRALWTSLGALAVLAGVAATG